jgi:hypothetical protein
MLSLALGGVFRVAWISSSTECPPYANVTPPKEFRTPLQRGHPSPRGSYVGLKFSEREATMARIPDSIE